MTCTSCGREVSLGHSWCPSCRGPVEFGVRDRERLAVDVRARVLWGDPVEDIRGDWLKKGAPAPVVQEALRSAALERRRHYRALGFRDLGLAVVCFVLAAGAAWHFQTVTRKKVSVPPKEGVTILISMAALPAIGLALTLRGFGRVTHGGKEGVSVTQSDDVLDD